MYEKKKNIYIIKTGLSPISELKALKVVELLTELEMHCSRVIFERCMFRWKGKCDHFSCVYHKDI